jgi:hypothetical protein
VPVLFLKLFLCDLDVIAVVEAKGRLHQSEKRS